MAKNRPQVITENVGMKQKSMERQEPLNSARALLLSTSSEWKRAISRRVRSIRLYKRERSRGYIH
ncbi:unnamed protein product [Moneuplotes crassus]|uniref:Uncharacterized protein n=1 Tax=Euplotes crassus TaxID=5936 RepID=A0AAD1X951_EUPCR|nr:unnamed protein product [Moneuplotes crassus]